MNITIAKEFTFDAAHCLPLLPDGHKCKRMHGHTYRAAIVLTGSVDAAGILIDYDEIAKLWAPLHEMLDHRVLNDVSGLSCPTTEVLVHWCLSLLEPELRAYPNVASVTIRVSESSTTWAEAGLAVLR